MFAVAAIELVIVPAFVAGFKKKWTYGFMLVLHGISPLSSYNQYFAPFEKVNPIFFQHGRRLPHATRFSLFETKIRSLHFEMTEHPGAPKDRRHFHAKTLRAFHK
jgi:hypothetical protein